MIKRQHIIAPSILSADFGRLGEEVEAVTAGGADWIHVDVMDGRFVPPITLGAAITQAVSRHTHLPLDVHLMVEQPARHIDAFAEAGAAGITVHQEACPHLHMTLRAIRSLGCKAGVAINPGTALSSLDAVLEHCDLVTVMTVNPGWGGQTVIPSAIAKAAALRALLDERGLGALIEVDGGVKLGNVADFAAADVLVSGSGIFHHGDYEATISRLREIAGA